MKKQALSFMVVLSSLSTIQSQNFDWARSMGASGQDMGHAIALDPSGNVITVGSYSFTVDFDPSASGIQNLNSINGSTGIFISKLSPSGNYIWAKSFDGASIYNWVRSVASDANGNIYVTGDFGAVTDFDPSPSATFTLAPSGPTDMFVSKLDASGNFVWAFKLGGITNSDYANSITTDAAGNVYLTGNFSQTIDFDPSPSGTSNLSSIGGGDVFVCKYTTAGSFVWAKRIGGGGGTMGAAVAVDASQNVYATGWFNGTADMDPSPATTYTLASMGAQDMFVTKLDASGNFVWAQQIGGSGQDQPKAIALDANSNVYLTGSFDAIADFDPSAATHTLSAGAGKDIFICKLNANGSFAWAHNFGATSADNSSGMSIAVNTQGNVFTTGGFYQTVDFDPSASSVYTLSSPGGLGTFILKLDGSGNFGWAKQIGSNSYDLGQGIAADASGNVYTTGAFYDVADFDPSSTSSYTLASTGLYDIFISKLKEEGGPTVGFTENVSPDIFLSLYPNPTTGLFTLNTAAYENVLAVIYDITGKIVLSVKLEGNSNTLDIRHLNKGIYQLDLIQNEAPASHTKVIKLD